LSFLSKKIRDDKIEVFSASREVFSKQRFNPSAFDDVEKLELQSGEIGLLKQLKVCVSNMCRL